MAISWATASSPRWPASFYTRSTRDSAVYVQIIMSAMRISTSLLGEGLRDFL